MCAPQSIGWALTGSSGLSRMRIHGGARDGIRAGPLPTVWGAAHADVCEFRALSEDELKDEMERQIRMEEQRRKAPL